jgi:putative transposase
VVILDRAGWPGNITLLELPPYSPELNPVERVWHYLRSHWLANSVFPNLADIMDACETAWQRFAAEQLDRLALHGRLGSRFDRSVGDACNRAVA